MERLVWFSLAVTRPRVTCLSSLLGDDVTSSPPPHVMCPLSLPGDDVMSGHYPGPVRGRQRGDQDCGGVLPGAHRRREHGFVRE